MKRLHLALSILSGLLVAGTAGAAPINFYASGSFTSSSGGVISTGVPPFGDPYTNNQVTYTSGSSSVSIQYADLATATNPAMVLTPTNVSYGIFRVSDGSALSPINIGAFTFSLVVHDLTDGGTVTFLGSSAGGTISDTSSNVSVTWSPLTGSVGPSVWTIFSPTPLIAPTTTGGQTTIQGTVTTSSTPEPASLFLLGSGLIGFGLISSRRFSSKKK